VDLSRPASRPLVFARLVWLNARKSKVSAYIELQCRSNFSFLQGASHPQELVSRAAELGYRGLALTDECSVAGVVRAHEEAKRLQQTGVDFKLLLGASFEVHESAHEPAQGPTEGPASLAPLRLVIIARDRQGWGELCELITLARLREVKGRYRLTTDDLEAVAHRTARWAHNVVLLVPLHQHGNDPHHHDQLVRQSHWAQQHFKHAAIALNLLLQGDDDARIQRVQAASRASGLPIVASGDVLMHRRSRKAVQDVLTAIAQKRSIHACGRRLKPNAEQHLRTLRRLCALHDNAWLQQTLELAALCDFSLDELGYEYPTELVPQGATPISHLRTLTALGAKQRYPQGVPQTVHTQLEREFALIQALRYEAFFLTVEDIVRHARSLGILCQGRGSAANSAVCYCLGITEVDPTQTTLLFERFISRERNEPPDIDVDFEHERREEVIQYIYQKYGVQRTALAAALSTYRTRSVVRDVGKALSLDASQIDAVASSIHWFDDASRLSQSLAQAGLDANAPEVKRWMSLVGAIRGFPRHLSQHVGGFVIARDKLSRLVPIENAAMPNRRVIQWDKDDLESIGLLKVDVLALGMLTTIRKTLALMTSWDQQHAALDTVRAAWRVQDIPREDLATYAMCTRADTVGVFQIESRAQMSMLPRLKPQCLYDLVIEVAIVRPGPIQGGMVHPYLQRRELQRAGQLEPSAHPALDVALGRTLGVPIFQEQVMQVCMIAAGFTPGEADQLRRAMAAWRCDGHIDAFEQRIKQGMAERGYDAAFADAIFKQICGFGEYGFPESHAYSFALLAYLSAWMKCHRPAAFLAALLNSQPMGFYAPAQLVQDARRHGVVVLPVDVKHSHWDCTLEPVPQTVDTTASQAAVRLGLRQVAGLSQEAALRIPAARAQQTFIDMDDLTRRAALGARDLLLLARADALQSLSGHRRQQVWQASGAWGARAGEAKAALLRDAPPRAVSRTASHTPLRNQEPELVAAHEGEAVVLDYASTGLTLRSHPLALLRERLKRRGFASANELATRADGQRASGCGLVTMRQQPETAKGVVFVTLEDETGQLNIIVWRHVREAQRQVLLGAKLMGVHGLWQRSAEGVMHLVAQRLVDMTPWLGALHTASRDFR
jgi:error-prone DNA polymerase